MPRKLMLEQRKRVETFISSIKDEKNGFSFGTPWRYDEHALTCVVPILRKSKAKVNYLTLAEAKNVELEDTGDISKAKITNKEDLPIFIRMGDLLTGATQERTVTSSIIIMPGETRELDIVCIHASKGIRSGAEYIWDGYAPDKDYIFLHQNYTSGRVNQQTSWQADRNYSYKSNMMACNFMNTSFTGGLSGLTGGRGMSSGPVMSSGEFSVPGQSFSIAADDLYETRKAVNKVFQDIIKEVPLIKDQTGMALIDTKGFHSIDCYNLHAPYKAIKDALIGKESTAISDRAQDNVFEFKPEFAKKTINEVLEKQFEEKVVFENDRAKTIILEIEEFLGEAVLLDNKVIHLLLTRKDQ